MNERIFGLEPNPSYQSTGEMFRLGETTSHADLFVNGERRLYVRGERGAENLQPQLEVGELAGWNRLLRKDSGGDSYLAIPSHARSMANVLSGTPAWPTEKTEVLDRVVRYVENVKEKFGKIDIGVGFDSIAVTRDERPEVVVLPSHQLSNDSTSVELWRKTISADLRHILSTTQSPELAEDFERQLELAVKGQEKQ